MKAKVNDRTSRQRNATGRGHLLQLYDASANDTDNMARDDTRGVPDDAQSNGPRTPADRPGSHHSHLVQYRFSGLLHHVPEVRRRRTDFPGIVWRPATVLDVGPLGIGVWTDR